MKAVKCLIRFRTQIYFLFLSAQQVWHSLPRTTLPMRRTRGPSSALCRRITASCRAVTCRRGVWRDTSAVWTWMISCTIRHWASWPSPFSTPAPSSPGSVSTGTDTTPAATPDTETHTKEPSTLTTSDTPGSLYFRYLLETHLHRRTCENSHPADWCSLCLMWTYWKRTSFPKNCLKCFFFCKWWCV